MPDPIAPPEERPCIKVCEYDEDTEWCLGCGMTKREKKAWKRAPEYRGAIHANLPARLDAMAAAGHRTGKTAKK
ncbi:DUF1289 domain-containing protein [Roseomonas populi]|uniref:DUF1289 domain-containing protein n=1 Tax=Roseomonas populi TaxID=3121582 RepID=A0ABT1X821_9PROT|nr:DUF1289 domain-containing protein [Roseomonas pecuniae]MCR0984252.1 DUF1289 domain-containing protein [Roseomonas pecuniae]